MIAREGGAVEHRLHLAPELPGQVSPTVGLCLEEKK